MMIDHANKEAFKDTNLAEKHLAAIDKEILKIPNGFGKKRRV
jgi:hypothetical protein